MADELVTALLKDAGLRVVMVLSGGVAREGRKFQQAEGAAATLFGLTLAAGLLLGSQQKSRARINLQIECDGPVRGLFVDASAEGEVRGYVKNPAFALEGEAGTFRWRPALGNSGFLSVLRELGGGEFYRSSVQLTHFDVAKDLESYFKVSEQLETHVLLEAVPRAAESLGSVVGMMLQPLPDGDRDLLRSLAEGLLVQGPRPLLEADPGRSAVSLLRALFPQPDLEVMSRYPVAYVCGCSKERVKRALLAMGRAELTNMLETEGKAEATCEFCGTRFEVTTAELRELLQPS